MGCINTVEHIMSYYQDRTSHSRRDLEEFHPIKKVREHIQEMLDGGAIQPSQLLWCNTIMLVQKKDGTLHFCNDL